MPCSSHDLRLLVDPVMLSALPRHKVVLLEPESDLLLGVLDAIRSVADVAANVLELRSVSVLGHGDSGMLTMAKSPRMVPGADANGLVAPRRAKVALMSAPPR